MMYDRREIMSFEITECSLIYRKYFPFWDHLTDEQRGLLCANTTARSFPKGTNIHGLEDACTGAILVVSGCLRAYLLSENGRIAIYIQHVILQLECQVHEQKICRKCGSEIRMKWIGGRSSYYCPHCQK